MRAWCHEQLVKSRVESQTNFEVEDRVFQSLEKGLKYASSYKETYTYVKKRKRSSYSIQYTG